MASSNPAAPICPKCKRSNGVNTDFFVSGVWRNGDWRLEQPESQETSSTHYYPCGHEGDYEEFQQ